MSFSDILYRLLIAPLEMIFEVIYYITYNLSLNPGIAIIALSFIMNILLLPMYKQTDAIQEEAIATEKRLRPWVQHIKKTFKGDERFMMLRTYYRENNYKQTDILKGISPLLLEIPFFMAAYHFLSHLQILEGAHFGIIENLGVPDALIDFGAFSINLLPVLMTAINIMSASIYTKGASAKTKIQLYGMAVVFLVLLYDSPAGLVFYWTLNNLFSLIKNIIVRTKNPKLTASLTVSVCSLACIGGFFVKPAASWRTAQIILIFLLMNIPSVFYFINLKKKNKVSKWNISTILGKIDEKNGKKIFVSSCIFMTVLVGLMIPSALVHSSPDEFIIKGSNLNPLVYVLSTFLVSAGTFLIWFSVFYHLIKPTWKKIAEFASVTLCICSVINYVFFGRNYGNMSNNLVFDQKLIVNTLELLINVAVLTAVSLLFYILWKKKANFIKIGSLVFAFAMLATSGFDLFTANGVIKPALEAQKNDKFNEEDKIIPLSTKGKNVVVIMLDRAISGYLPYIFNEKPELQNQFAGFTYYPNTISFGGHTNFGLPSVMGGYEYTPLEMNKRDDMLLVDKHNEALQMMPLMFSKNNFKVTVCDPTYAGYGWIPDLSIYDKYPQIDAHITMGKYNGTVEEIAKETTDTLKRNFYFYSAMKISPVFCHASMYDSGRYLNLNKSGIMGQVRPSTLQATGLDPYFNNSVNVLNKLPSLTQISDSDLNTFMVMCNETTHSPTLLQLPDYKNVPHVDNTGLTDAFPVKVSTNGETMQLVNDYQITHYHCNMASYIQIGKWLDFLRESGVYENTRIILVSDHGESVNQFSNMILDKRPASDNVSKGDDSFIFEDAMKYNPLLLVKDFGETEGFRTDETFMTNADTPLIAAKDLISDPVNPFTNKNIVEFAESKDKFYISASHMWNTGENNGYKYMPGLWLTVHDDVRIKDNWQYVDENALPN